MKVSMNNGTKKLRLSLAASFGWICHLNQFQKSWSLDPIRSSLLSWPVIRLVLDNCLLGLFRGIVDIHVLLPCRNFSFSTKFCKQLRWNCPSDILPGLQRSNIDSTQLFSILQTCSNLECLFVCRPEPQNMTVKCLEFMLMQARVELAIKSKNIEMNNMADCSELKLNVLFPHLRSTKEHRASKTSDRICWSLDAFTSLCEGVSWGVNHIFGLSSLCSKSDHTFLQSKRHLLYFKVCIL